MDDSLAISTEFLALLFALVALALAGLTRRSCIKRGLPWRLRTAVNVSLVGAAFLGWVVTTSLYEDYTFSAKMAEAVKFGINLGTALDQHRVKTKSLAKSTEELGFAIPREKVAIVNIETEDRIAVMLSLRRVAGKRLVFLATGPDGARTWRCTSRDVMLFDLPSVCQEIYKTSG
jgi:hypothetical protein